MSLSQVEDIEQKEEEVSILERKSLCSLCWREGEGCLPRENTVQYGLPQRPRGDAVQSSSGGSLYDWL